MNFNIDKIKIIPKGLWHGKETLKFCNAGSASKIIEGGNDEVEVTSIDQEINERVTFIKLDIEGAELEALKGAKNIICRDVPDLAVSIYHKNSDIVDIPEYILSLNPSYKLYVRHYFYNNWETILYAVTD